MKRKIKRISDSTSSSSSDGFKYIRRRNVVGNLINFRGLVYAPVNENGVIFLFGKVAADLNMYVETIRPGYPDCVAKRYVGNSKWEEIRIEFEYNSSHFLLHKHDPDYCDAIVCWIHDWSDHPKTIEIIELQSLIKQLENTVIEEPDKIAELSQFNIEDLIHDKKLQVLYEKLHSQIIKINKSIWRKVSERSITYYCPEKVFTYLKSQKKRLRFTVFTNGKNIPGVELIDYERGGQKWGRLYISRDNEIAKATKALKSAYNRITEAIKRGDNTGWYAESE